MKVFKKERRWRMRHKGWRALHRAEALSSKYPVNTETLRKQEEATEKIELVCKELDSEEIARHGWHEHICTFEMLSNDKSRQMRECREWLKAHPIEYPGGNDLDIWSPCDFCAMMNYVAMDDEGKIMYTTRTIPREMLQFAKQFSTHMKQEANEIDI